jgi:hypothetical protein
VSESHSTVLFEWLHIICHIDAAIDVKLFDSYSLLSNEINQITCYMRKGETSGKRIEYVEGRSVTVCLVLSVDGLIEMLDHVFEQVL